MLVSVVARLFASGVIIAHSWKLLWFLNGSHHSKRPELLIFQMIAGHRTVALAPTHPDYQQKKISLDVCLLFCATNSEHYPFLLRFLRLGWENMNCTSPVSHSFLKQFKPLRFSLGFLSVISKLLPFAGRVLKAKLILLLSSLSFVGACRVQFRLTLEVMILCHPHILKWNDIRSKMTQPHMMAGEEIYMLLQVSVWKTTKAFAE